MAMINCPECSTQISQKAKYCPKCGCQIRDKNQVFLIIYAVVITLLAGLYFLGFLGKNENPLTIKSVAGQERIAYNLSKEHVKKFLNYPKIVRFPKIKESKDNIIDLGSGRYKIDGELEYEMDDKIVYHTHYVCILINKGQNRWILESIQVYDKEPAKLNE
jgi:hypothetical protein